MKKNIRYLPWKERVRLYEEAMRLRKENGWGYVKIGRAIDVHYDVVRHWIHHRRNPMRHGRMKLWEPKPSPELSYIIGVCYGDCDLPVRGKSYNRTARCIRLRVRDKEFAERFAICIAKVLDKSPNKMGFEKGQHRVIEYNYYLHEFLKGCLEEHKTYIERHPAEFIKGIIDSEGAIVVTPVKWKHYKWLSSYITISNSDIDLLEYVKKLLEDDFNITSRIRLSYKAGSKVFFRGKVYYRGKDAYDLKIARTRDLIIFSKKIGFSIRKKRRKLSDVIRIVDKCPNRKNAYHAWLDEYQKVNKRWVRKTL